MGSFYTTLFDTWQPGATASAEASLFQVPQGGDATHVDTFTNARGAAQLPADETFTIKRIGLHVDEALVQADIEKVATGGLIEIRIKDKIVFSAPVRACWDFSGFLGHFTQATAALVTGLGPSGRGVVFDPPLVLPGGQRFSVRCKQGVALSTATDVKVVLEGILETPD